MAPPRRCASKASASQHPTVRSKRSHSAAMIAHVNMPQPKAAEARLARSLTASSSRPTTEIFRTAARFLPLEDPQRDGLPVHARSTASGPRVDLVSRSCEQKNIAKCGFILDAASLLRRTTAAESPRRCHQAPAHLSSWRTISSSAPMAAPSVIAMSSMRRNCLGRGQPCATRPAPPRRRGFRGTGKSAVVAQEGFGSESWNTMNHRGAFCRANDKSCTTSHLSLARSNAAGN